jgi:hypothetical protein
MTVESPPVTIMESWYTPSQSERLVHLSLSSMVGRLEVFRPTDSSQRPYKCLNHRIDEHSWYLVRPKLGWIS